jgi:hypothetical protein
MTTNMATTHTHTDTSTRAHRDPPRPPRRLPRPQPLRQPSQSDDAPSKTLSGYDELLRAVEEYDNTQPESSDAALRRRLTLDDTDLSTVSLNNARSLVNTAVRQQKSGALSLLISNGLQLPTGKEALGLWTTCLIVAPANIELMQNLRVAGLSEEGIERPLNGTLKGLCAQGEAAVITGLLKFFDGAAVDRSTFEQVSTFGDSEVRGCGEAHARFKHSRPPSHHHATH